MSRFDLSRRRLVAGLAATSALLDRPAVAQVDTTAHLVPADGVDDQTWRAAAATHFGGEIIVGQDMMIV